MNYALLVKIFGSELFDFKDFFELFFRFSINIFVAFIVIRLLYYPSQKRKDYLFTYFLFNILIFLLCYLLSNIKLSIGFAFGLFAIFGILRYRTEAVPIREMTYLFMVIAVAVLNSLTNKKISIAEIVFTNGIILLITYLLEKVFLIKHESRKTVLYERIELITPEKRVELIVDLKARTGLEIHRVEIGKIDFLRDTATIRIFYFENEFRESEEFYENSNQ
ncbi:MAG: DUF4956 domain-containing protein [Bacteroidetes bacterium]|nr:DUF4956 domain-containing protein [Bacteroidota bacterium]MBV6461776.1 hypothetical protein [Flavobacteriales bacterium]WKZ75891.1 MAG: DUF4956 domain-containing protein [Vicingaceae bacterium]MCL4816731.1 DUF4956 domain-containing protein [Flavobacteriales bacterium]NOG95567.1 DUF4956 domain-containing protein [Bacteroidota bacterium]